MLIEVVVDFLNGLDPKFVFGILFTVVCSVIISILMRDAPLADLHGPPGAIFWGNTFQFVSPTVDIFAKLLEWSKVYGDTFKLYMRPGGYFVYTSKPEYLKYILLQNASNYTKSDVLASMIPSTCKSIIFADGKKYQWQKKFIRPLFSFHGSKVYMKVYNDKTDKLIEVLNRDISMQTRPNDNQFAKLEILELLLDLCLDIFGECTLGYEFNSLTNGRSKESLAFLSLITSEFNLAKLAVAKTFPFLSLFNNETNTIQEKYQIIKSVISEAISKRMEQLEDEDDVFETGDLLDVIIKMYDPMKRAVNDEELYSQIFTFMFAGFEPTSLTMFWTLFLLAQNENIQSKLRAEIDSILGQSDDIQLETVNKLEFLSKCIKEAQRLYPPVILVRRKAKKDDYLGNIKVPAGTDVAIGICSVHRDETFWENPTEYDPDRFTNTTEKEEANGYKFLPYSRGSRMCLATTFVDMEIKVALAKLIKRFRFSLKHDQPSIIPCKVTASLKPRTSPIFLVQRLY